MGHWCLIIAAPRSLGHPCPANGDTHVRLADPNRRFFPARRLQFTVGIIARREKELASY